MAYASPTFLFQNRFGTYYFRCRIPQSVKSKYHTKKSEIRKSLSTKDYRTAIQLARRLWVKMFDNDFFLSPDSKSKASKPICPPPPFPNNIDEPVPRLNYIQNSIPPENEIKLSEIIDKFCIENSERWGGSFEHKEVRPIMTILMELIGNKASNAIQLSDIVQFKEVFVQLPKNRRKIKRYRDKSVKELLDLDIPKEDLLSLTTIKKCFTILVSFLTWCSDNHFLKSDLARPLQRYNRQNKKVQREFEDREPFNSDDLKKLFAGKEYVEGTHNRASEQWLPLISLYSAMRLREILQLYKEDIRKDKKSGIYYFDIKEDKDKGQRVKTKSSQRKVPIHPKLIEFGFLKYVNRVTNGKPIFMDINPQNIDTRSHYLSKWFGRYRKRCKVGIAKGEKKSFHSFRHLVCTCLKHKGISIDIIEEITGHTSGRSSQTQTRYTLPYELGTKNDALSALNFDDVIDFDKLIFRYY